MNYMNDSAAQDPFIAVFFQFAMRAQPGVTSVARRRELLPDQAWYRSRHFTNYRSVAGVDDCIYGAVFGGGDALDGSRGLPSDVIAGFSIHNASNSTFSVADRELCRIALSALAPIGGSLLHSGRLGASHLFALLTPRQREVLLLLNDGLAAKQIASQLNLSPASVHTYVQAICRRLGVRGRAEALALCNQKGWLVARGTTTR